MSNVLPPMKFARDCEVGDVIDTGHGPGDLISVHDLNNGMMLLRWGVGEKDSKFVSAFTGIIWFGKFRPEIYV